MRYPIVVRYSRALLVALLCALPARAQVRIEGQERRVEVGVWVYDERTEETVLLGSGDAEAVAPDFGPFQRALEVRVDAFPPPEANVSEGIASQSSTISPVRFHGSGRVEVYAESDEGGSKGLGLSLYRVTFAADEPQWYHLGTQMFDDPDWAPERFDGYVRLTRLDGGGGPVVLLDEEISPARDPNAGRWDEEFTGELPVGRYEFEFFTSQDTDRGSGYGYEFEMTLATVPEPGAAALVLGAAAMLLRRRPRAQ